MKKSEVRTTIDLPKVVHTRFRKIKEITGKTGKQMLMEKIDEEFQKLKSR